MALDDGRMTMGAPPFGRVSSNAVLGADIFIGDQETYEIGRYSPLGKLESMIRKLGVDLAIQPEEIDALKEGQIAAAPSHERTALRRYLADIDVPETRPAYLRFLPDNEGNLWISEYARTPNIPGRWSVFDDTGRWLGEVMMPTRFQPHQIGTGWMLGVTRDELGVQRVEMRGLSK